RSIRRQHDLGRLHSTVTCEPDSSPRSETASAVIAAVITSPPLSLTFTDAITSPVLICSTVPTIWLRVLSCMTAPAALRTNPTTCTRSLNGCRGQRIAASARLPDGSAAVGLALARAGAPPCAEMQAQKKLADPVARAPAAV